MSATALIHRTARPSISAMSSLLGISPKCVQLVMIIVQIASGCAAHTVFFSHGSPTDVSLPGWQRPACPERTRLAVRHVRHGSVSPLGSCYFGWMSYFFRLLWVASHWFCHFVTRASAGLHRRGWEVEMKLLRERKRLFTGWW